MKTQSSQSAEGAEAPVTVKLLKPHTDAGVDYEVGAEITLPKVLADWLEGVGTAKPVTQ